MSNDELTFNKLVKAIRNVDDVLSRQASKAVNLSLTIRNWLIGMRIFEYELNGGDRALYGKSLMADLAETLSKHGVSNCNHRELYHYLDFYRLYPEIVGTLSPKLKRLLPNGYDNAKKLGTLSPKSRFSPQKLLESLSYSHFRQLVEFDDSLKRAFYEIECVKGGWSVRELKRQIGSLYYERCGLSRNKKKLSKLAQSGAESDSPALTIRDPYVFEFLGIKPPEVMGESELEDSLLDGLRNFLLELGHGFCFEARQKRLLIGDEHFFVDLVFYHRILKCHILVELKTDRFNHGHIGQLNTYLNWYAKNMAADGDNPPVGILLCAKKNDALVEYALAGMDNQLFVSKYMLNLPAKDDMQRFLEAQISG